MSTPARFETVDRLRGAEDVDVELDVVESVEYWDEIESEGGIAGVVKTSPDVLVVVDVDVDG